MMMMIVNDETMIQNSSDPCKRPDTEEFEEVDLETVIENQEDEEEERREGTNAQDIGGSK